MVVIEQIATALSLLIWLYLLLARGGFWRPPVAEQQPRQRAGKADPAAGPRIVAVVPARDEAEVIGDTIGSLLRQDYRGRLHIVLVDDRSSDGTARVAAETAAALGGSERLTILDGAALPAGWTGKVWAMAQGVEAAASLGADYILFTDADIHHERSNLSSLVAIAEAHGRDLVSYMVRLSCTSIAEKLLIPAFVFFFFELYPPAWIASARSRVAAAAGGCMLVRPRALAAIGGLARIRSALIDDCALARAVKSAGGRLWLGLTRTAHSTRGYASFGEIGRMISRSAFNQLRHSYPLLALTLLGLFVTYVVPPLALLSGAAATMGLGALAWLLMSAAYAPMVRFYGLAPLWCATLPLVAVFYAAATLHSALRFALGRGGQWKGRIQDLRA